MKKIAPLIIVVILILSGFGAVAISDNSNERDLFHKANFSEPIIQDQGQYITIDLPGSTTYTSQPGNPILPTYSKLFTFPVGTRITDISFICSEQQEILLSKEVMLAPEPLTVSQFTYESKIEEVKNQEICSIDTVYPESPLKYKVGCGLDGNKHVIYLTVYYFPLLYSSKNKIIYFTDSVEIKVTYQIRENPLVSSDEFDLVVVSPAEYSEQLQPLIDHKNGVGVSTTYITTEDIYAIYQGRDEAEQIKYFIKDAIETMGAEYVLLVGSIYKLPIRTTYPSMWSRQKEIISDLYYADIYDSEMNFSSWDTNNDSKFGETGVDDVDLYPDVHLGRLACDSAEEVTVVVDKIIHYETETYGQDWFNNMIFIGGNTFPYFFAPGNEGEILNEIIMDIMSDFNPTVIWTSKHNFNPLTISLAIDKGAGFLDYSGHGFEHGMGTYPPLRRKMKTYLTPNINFLVNGYKLPIIFFDACLTARLDFVLQDLLDYKVFRILNLLAQLLNVNTSKKLPCYAWCFVKHEGGGAIATIGATRTAYGGVDSGAGKMSIEFFSAYENSEMLGQMMTEMQNQYINDVPDDEFTVEEFLLLGDPSLKMGGYPN